MADANHNAPSVFHDRFVTARSSLRRRRTIPHLRFADRAPPVLHLWMKLSGRWIEAAGFEPGQRLRIDVTHGRLVITPMDETDGAPVGQDAFPGADPATGQQQFPVMTGDAQ
ncbi:type I toxin-antitoxin system SymE family toxin [Burkholderia sp. JP2-270]|uniref:SymE family type I addiction module toxin n=1 Tax=Burkholderia sp. JP2-270 TaxID=2217913 RepID=UPI000DA34EAB|nr:SymE family type I addiction module toxin [Burkholderia sp. JP2-270]AWV03026.1 type I toxin-antitoxin system SymE family toxin [Burkholderia sp. JP2-270]